MFGKSVQVVLVVVTGALLIAFKVTAAGSGTPPRALWAALVVVIGAGLAYEIAARQDRKKRRSTSEGESRDKG